MEGSDVHLRYDVAVVDITPLGTPLLLAARPIAVSSVTGHRPSSTCTRPTVPPQSNRAGFTLASVRLDLDFPGMVRKLKGVALMTPAQCEIQGIPCPARLEDQLIGRLSWCSSVANVT